MLFTKYLSCLTKSKRMLAAVLAGCMFTACLAGCAKTGQDADDLSMEMSDSVQASSETPGQASSMGRYVETEFSYGEDCNMDMGNQIIPWEGGLYLADTMGEGVSADLTAKTL